MQSAEAQPGKQIVITQVLGKCIAWDAAANFLPGHIRINSIAPGIGNLLGRIEVFGDPDRVIAGKTYKEIRLTFMSTMD